MHKLHVTRGKRNEANVEERKARIKKSMQVDSLDRFECDKSGIIKHIYRYGGRHGENSNFVIFC